jgi:hypothetical protein
MNYIPNLILEKSGDLIQLKDSQMRRKIGKKNCLFFFLVFAKQTQNKIKVEGHILI